MHVKINTHKFSCYTKTSASAGCPCHPGAADATGEKPEPNHIVQMGILDIFSSLCTNSRDGTSSPKVTRTVLSPRNMCYGHSHH